MSGPKSSRYRVDAKRRKELEKQMKEKISQLENEIRQKEAQLIKVEKENIKYDKEELPKTYNLKLNADEVFPYNKTEDKPIVMKIENKSLFAENIQEKFQQKLSDNTNKISKAKKVETIKFADNPIVMQESIVFGKNSSRLIKEKINSLLPCDDEIIDELNMEYFLLNDLIDDYMMNVTTSSRSELLNFKDSLNNIMNDNKLDSKYKLSQIQNRKEVFLLTKEKYDVESRYCEEQKSKYDDLYKEYQAICELLDEKAEEVQLDILDIDKSMSLLKEKVDEKKEELTKDMEAEYVSESINSVMKELGYDIIASDYMSTSKRNVMHNIYDFQDKNVINVYTSDNGGLMFEVTGIKEKNELSHNDKLRIKEGMDKFCPQYQKIKDALNAKGINITNENLLPADISFAKAINLEDKLGKNQKSKKNSKRNVNKPKYKTL